MSTVANLAGRRVLVTGASSGLGAEACRSLVACGASVAMLARRKHRLIELEAELGERAKGFACDVTIDADLKSTVAAAAEQLGGLDAMVAVAGRGSAGTLMTGEPDGWRELLELNLLALLATARFTYDHFGKSGRRDLLFVGSAGGINAMPGVGIYSTGRRGLRAAVETLRLELAGEGINVGMIVPGMFDTEGLVAASQVNGNVDFPRDVMKGFADGGWHPGPPGAVADAISFMLGQPEGVAINELVIRPTSQHFP
jgi:NADP-dependent 3-hydroxy acid dehydrogenase YdfG